MLRLRKLPDGRKAIDGLEALPDEDWKQFPIHPSYYISNLGRVFGPKGLRKVVTSSGYPNFVVQLGPKQKCFLVHIVVCQLFNGDSPPSKPIVLHKDHDRGNCRWDNLYWGTHKENTQEMLIAGRGVTGEKNAATPLTWTKVRAIRARAALGESGYHISKDFPEVSAVTVNNIISRRTWKETSHVS